MAWLLGSGVEDEMVGPVESPSRWSQAEGSMRGIFVHSNQTTYFFEGRRDEG